MLQSDGGGEYQGLNSLLDSFGITRKIYCTHTPKQNEITERKHMHVVEMELTLLAQAKMPLG